MFSRCTMQAVIFVLLASVTAHAQEEDPSKIFEQANVQKKVESKLKQYNQYKQRY